jgi:hypothetical protein
MQSHSNSSRGASIWQQDPTDAGQTLLDARQDCTGLTPNAFDALTCSTALKGLENNAQATRHPRPGATCFISTLSAIGSTLIKSGSSSSGDNHGARVIESREKQSSTARCTDSW